MISGIVVLAAIGLPPTTAAAAVGCSDGGTCNATYCEITCGSDAEYIVIGRLWNGSWQGVGVCVFNTDGSYSKGTYADREEMNTDSADYRIFAGDGNDLFRLADKSGESCGTGWAIYGQLDDSTDTFMIRGEGGADVIHLCDTVAATEPSTSDCITYTTGQNAGRADGWTGIDQIYGSPYAEELWGHDSGDYLYAFSGADILHGGAGSDNLYGGSSCDALYGDTDTGDFCDCGDGLTHEGEADASCESSRHCYGCLESPEPGGDTDWYGFTPMPASYGSSDAGTGSEADAGE